MQAMPLKDPRIVAEVAIGSATRPHRCTAETASRFNNCIEDTSDDKASMDDPLKCMDDDTSTSAWPSSRKLSSDECERHRVFFTRFAALVGALCYSQSSAGSLGGWLRLQDVR